MLNTETLTVLKARYPEAEKILGNLAKKANRYGNNSITYKIVGETTVGITVTRYINGEMREVIEQSPAYLVEVTGDAPKIKGYTFVARLEPISDGVNLIHKVPTQEDICVNDKFKTSGIECQHCNTLRNRKDLFVIENDATGEQIQVGRNCLHDYLGIDNPQDLIRKCEFWFAINNNDFMTRRENEFSVVDVLAYSNVITRTEGYTKGGVTGGMVYDCVTGQKQIKEIYRYIKLIGDEDYTEARKAIEWFATKEPDSDYMRNVKLLIDKRFILSKHINLVASAMYVYRKEMQKRVEKEAQKDLFAPKKLNEYAGEVGQKIEIKNAVVVYHNIFDSRFDNGQYSAVKFIDEDGRMFSSFTTSNKIEWSKLKHDKTPVNFTAKVKKHEEYKDQKQTIVNFVKQV